MRKMKETAIASKLR